MSKENLYLDGVQRVRDPFNVKMSTDLGIGTLKFAYCTKASKPGHYREVKIELNRDFVGFVADALYQYLESEEADLRRLRTHLEGADR